MEKKLCEPCKEPIVDKLPPCPLMCKSPKCKAYMVRNILQDHQNVPIFPFSLLGIFSYLLNYTSYSSFV